MLKKQILKNQMIAIAQADVLFEADCFGYLYGTRVNATVHRGQKWIVEKSGKYWYARRANPHKNGVTIRMTDAAFQKVFKPILIGGNA